MTPPIQQPPSDSISLYMLWSRLTRVGAWDMARMRNEVESFERRPTVSILLPVHDPTRAWLVAALDSVLSQTYPDWELCICDDGSSEPHVKEVLDLYQRVDSRVRVVRLESNAGIAKATNEAFALSTGEFVGLLDHDDAFAPHALFEVVKLLQGQPDADLIYTDEDKVSEEGEFLQPHFKCGWSPDMALCCNYLVHLSVYRRSILEEIGGWREGFDGAQDFDLMLRYTERTDEIHRLPAILYHWRMAEGSVAVLPESKPYTHERAREAIRDALKRRGIRGKVLDGFTPNTFRIEREIEGRPKVTVLIPLRPGADHHRCVASLVLHNTYPNCELVLMTSESEALKQTQPPGATALSVPAASTPLEMCNAAAERVDGEYILFLDSGVEAQGPGWVEAALQHAQRPEVGAVGGKLMSPDGHVLQAGLVLDPEVHPSLPQYFYRPFTREDPGFRIFVDLVRNCSAVSRACMMVSRETFQAAGGFEVQRLHSTFGDVDLCLGLREEGRLIVYTPYAAFTQHDPEPLPALAPGEAGYVRERWGEALADDPYDNPNLNWTAVDLHGSLQLMGMGIHRVKATRHPAARGAAREE